MSYNTRRTGSGGAGRGTPTTQVNYHQQPPNRTNSAQNRNPGYSTQQGNFNSSSQPAYSTQSGYNAGSTMPTTQTKAAQPQPPAQPPVQSQPSTPQAKPPVPTTPSLKQEPLTPADTPKIENAENGEEASTPKQPFWKKKPFVKLSNKVKRARQNAKLRRVLNPKNALTFLNELRPGAIKFVVREEAGWGYVASVDVDGKTFSGHALTVSKAKVQASEQALKHLLLEQLCKSQSATSTSEKDEVKDETEEKMETVEENDEAGEPKTKKARGEPVEDELPWGSLAAFALHKLFAEWQKEGTELPPHGPQEKYDEGVDVEEQYFSRRPPGPPEFGYPRRYPPAGPYGRGRGFPPYPPRGPPPPGFGMPRRPPPTAFPGPGPRPALPLGGAPLNIMPMKKIPEDASKRHPVMLLNQLKPNLIYQEFREGDPPNAFFRITVQIEGKEYAGRGKSKKEAKKNAAKAALAPLGIIYQDDD